MAGLFPSPHPAGGRGSWPPGLHRAALLLPAGVALFWSSLAFRRWVIPIPDFGPVYWDLLVAWVAVLVPLSAWSHLCGRRDDRRRPPESRGNRVRTSLELGLRNPPGSGTGGLRPDRSRDDRPLGPGNLAVLRVVATTPARVVNRALAPGLPLGPERPRVRSRSAPSHP